MSIRYDAALFSVVEFAGGITVAIVLWWGERRSRRPATLYVFIDWMRRFFLPLARPLGQVLGDAVVDGERRAHLPAPRHASPAIQRSGARAAVAAPRSRGAARGAVEFEHVWFAYQGAAARDEDWVLRDVSFRVGARASSVAFVGATGAGKTTIIKLLTRLYEVDARPHPARRRRPARAARSASCAGASRWCSRTCSCSAARSRRTSRSAAPTSTRADVERAARAVRGRTRFIAAAARGLRDAGCASAARNLSAGQRQLLSFARALAHGADVLVLDEATSSIDTETEALVQHGIHVLMEGKTALVIAHRLSTIEDVDRIHVLHHGRIVESGTHASSSRRAASTRGSTGCSRPASAARRGPRRSPTRRRRPPVGASAGVRSAALRWGATTA